MIDVIQKYKEFCDEKQISFKLDDKIISYDESTLFCPAGMQQYKNTFKDKSIVNKTVANIQSCLRLLDIDEIGDGTHFLYFNMMGLFSFREYTVKQTIEFWIEFLATLNLKPDYVTVHPEMIIEWEEYYKPFGIPVRFDENCTWSDGDLTGYCTEFYINDIEIGNIVNICGDSIDVGFGLERLDNLVNKTDSKSELEILNVTISKLLESGIQPSNKRHGYVLRKLIRVFVLKGGVTENEHVRAEQLRQQNLQKKYLKLKNKFKDKSPEWWFDTHGINLNLVGDLDLSK